MSRVSSASFILINVIKPTEKILQIYQSEQQTIVNILSVSDHISTNGFLFYSFCLNYLISFYFILLLPHPLICLVAD